MPRRMGFADTSEATGKRRATNVSLDAGILQEAKALEVNVSRACERGLVQAVAEAKKARWIEENAAALDSANSFVEKRGLPLARHRKF